MFPEFEAIEFPGLVEDPKKAIAALGGMNTISHVLSKKKTRLEVHLNPDNVYDKPAVGERKKISSFLIKVTVRRKKHSKEPPKCTIQYLGFVGNVYQFENLLDFQYLPIYKDPVTGQPADALSGLIPKSPLDLECLDNVKAPSIIIPKIFSRLDSVELVNFFYRDETSNDGLLTNLGQFTKAANDSTQLVSFDLDKPLPVNEDTEISKKLKVKWVTNEQFNKIKTLFEECPIWTRIALQHESGLHPEKLKVIVPAFAYFYSSGPWRSCLVRFGYDPRLDFNSRKYQIFDYRLRASTGIAQYISSRLEKIRNESIEDDYSIQDVNYPYITTDKLPRSRQCMMRYCDIHLPKVQKLIATLPTPEPNMVCNEKTGWLPVGFEQEVRQHVQEAVKNLLRNQLRKDNSLSAESDFDMEDNEEMDEIEEDDDEDNDDNTSNIFDDASSEVNQRHEQNPQNDSDDNSTNMDDFIEDFMERS